MGAPLLKERGDRAASRPPIRVMLVDDSIVARAVIARILSADEGFEVAAQAGSAARALAILAEQQVDIVLLDLEMPGQHGLDALPDIIAAAGNAKIVIVSSACADGAGATVRALTLGAADTMLKPEAGARTGHFAAALIDKLARLGRAPKLPLSEPVVRARPASLLPARVEPIDCIAIGASTGGLHALAAMFAAWPRDNDAPILVTQHLPAVFMPYFAEQLSRMVDRPARVATAGMRLQRGRVYVAPGTASLSLSDTGGAPQVVLDEKRSASGFLPSVDPMLDAVGEIFGARALAIMLSGMGRDGAQGAAAMVRAGGTLLAQDMASSVVWGMPGAVAGLAAEILPPEDIAEAVGRRTRAEGKRAWN